MILAKKYRKMLKGVKYEFRCDTNHWNLFIGGEYVYGFSMGSRVYPVRNEVVRKIKKRLKAMREERKNARHNNVSKS